MTGSMPRLSSTVRTFMIVAGSMLALIALFVGQALVRAWFHFSATPDFHTYVESTPVSDDATAARWPAAELLSEGGAWSLGAPDPFTLPEDDPELVPLKMRYDVELTHGNETLLDFSQEFALVAGENDGNRSAFAVRTIECETPDSVRVVARLWVSPDEELIGPNSEGNGMAVFDVMLVAGAGPDSLSVTRLPANPLQTFETSGPADALRSFFLASLHPTDPPAEEGLIHHFRQRVSLAWRRREGGSSSAGLFGHMHDMSTSQYSYGFKAETTQQGWSGPSSRSIEKHATYELNDRVW